MLQLFFISGSKSGKRTGEFKIIKILSIIFAGDILLCQLNEMNWILLIIAGLFEAGFASCLGKARGSTGLTATYWYAGFVICAAISGYLLIKVTQHLPIGTAYAVWTGVGATGTVLVGILVFNEPAEFWRLFFIVTLICSIIGLKVVSN